MTKALFKKQMMEVFSWTYMDRKSGKNRSKKGIITYALLYLFVFGFLAVSFFTVSSTLCKPLKEVNLGWLYFAVMGLISIAMGVFGSVFSTYASLYLAKDNDMLLSMPIAPSKILAVRLSGVYAMGLMYELIVMVPAVIVYFLNSPPNAAAAVFTLLIPIILSVFILTLSCILGWAVAFISVRLKNKSIAAVVLSVAFLAGYYYIYSRAYLIIEKILAEPQAAGSKMKSLLFPLYHMGLAAEGSPVSMLIFTAIIAVLFGITYIVISKSFLKIAAAGKGAAKAKYKNKAVKAKSVGSALLGKEMKRFFGSPTYMLNCGMGTLFMLAASAALLIKGSSINALINELALQDKDIIPLIAAAAICMITTMNDITAPSVSLEGKNIWLVQSLPVTAKQVLEAKLKLHLLLTLIPALILTVCAEIVIRPGALFALLMPITAAFFVAFSALAGLFLNLKSPNLKWTSESVPVKQSMGVMLALLGGWAAVLACGAVYFAVRQFISPAVYLIIIILLLALLDAVLYRWIKTKGADIFKSL